MRIVRLDEMPELRDKAASWFSEKWKEHGEEYYNSINDSLDMAVLLPKWYIVLVDNRIIAGAGVISNDPQIRKEKRPNICAVYVEKEYRGNKIAGALLEYICIDMMFHGVANLYLSTELTGFYERYGWEFVTEIIDNDEKNMRVYRRRLSMTGRE